jgi:hypothetical protein
MWPVRLSHLPSNFGALARDHVAYHASRPGDDVGTGCHSHRAVLVASPTPRSGSAPPAAYPLGSFFPDPLPSFVLGNVEMTVLLVQTVGRAREATDFRGCQ